MAYPQNERELLQLISRVQDGQASAEELHWLERAVELDERIRRVYLELMDLESEIFFHVVDYFADQPGAAESVAPPLLIDLRTIFDEPDAPGHPAFPAMSLASDAGGDVVSRGVSAVSQAIMWRHHPIRFLTTAAVLTLLLWIGWAAFLLPWGREHRMVGSQERPAVIETSRFVAQIVGGVAQWSESSGAAFPDAHLRLGQQLELLKGWALIRFNSGARVTVRGPAKFVIRNGGHLALAQGLAQVEVREPGAAGFAVSAPNGVELVDLGTAFVVDVANRGSETVVDAKVLEGKIRLTVGSGESRILEAGGASRVVGRQIRSLAVGEAPRFEPSPVVVNIDFGPSSIYRDRGAAPDVGTFWNNGADKTTAANLIASDGRTRTSIGYTSNRQHVGMRKGAEIALFDDYQFTHRGQGGLALTLVGLDNQKRYDVYIYTATTLGQGTACTVHGKTLTITGTDRERFIAGENYARFTEMTPHLGTILITLQETDVEHSAALINGLQIVERAAGVPAAPPESSPSEPAPKED